MVSRHVSIPADIAWFRVERPGAALDHFYVSVHRGATLLAERVTLWQTSVELGGQRIYGPTVTREHGFVSEQGELV